MLPNELQHESGKQHSRCNDKAFNISPWMFPDFTDDFSIYVIILFAPESWGVYGSLQLFTLFETDEVVVLLGLLEPSWTTVSGTSACPPSPAVYPARCMPVPSPWWRYRAWEHRQYSPIAPTPWQSRSGPCARGPSPGKETLEFNRRVESPTVRCHRVIPTPLRLTDELQCILHLGFGSSLFPGELRLDMGGGQLFFHQIADLGGATLTLVNRFAQVLLRLPVTNLAGVVDAGQRATHVVAAVFDSPFRDVGHMAVGTRHAALRGYRLQRAVIGVLRLDDGCTAQLMRVVGILQVVEVSFASPSSSRYATEDEVLAIGNEVVLHVALRETRSASPAAWLY